MKISTEIPKKHNTRFVAVWTNEFGIWSADMKVDEGEYLIFNEETQHFVEFNQSKAEPAWNHPYKEEGTIYIIEREK